MMFKAVKSAAISLALLSSMSAAFSHPVSVVPLPTHHATLLAARLVPHLVPAHATTSFTALQLNALLKKGSGNFFLNASTALPGSQRALYSSLKLTSETSITSSINLSNLSSGQFFATQYLPTSSGLVNGGLTFRAFGSNPLNTAVAPAVNPSTTLQSVFVSGPHPSIISASSSAFLLSKSLRTAPESAATRRIASLYGAVASKGAQIGALISSHPTGGILYGSFYNLSGSTFSYGSKIILAFGNNPYNNPAVPSIPYLANGSSILFGSKVFRPVSSGQFFGTEYFANSATVPNPLSYGGQYLYVFGAGNPLNVFAHSPILASAFASFFKF